MTNSTFDFAWNGTQKGFETQAQARLTFLDALANVGSIGQPSVVRNTSDDCNKLAESAQARLAFLDALANVGFFGQPSVFCNTSDDCNKFAESAQARLAVLDALANVSTKSFR